MAVIINSEARGEVIPRKIDLLLPYRLSDEIKKRARELSRIEEIRLRRGRAASISVNGQNVMLSCVLSGDEIEKVLSDALGNSLYAHSETINRGYVTLDGGIRIGICGRAASEGDRVYGVYDVSSLNIRLPRALMSVGQPICRELARLGGSAGVLIYSKPCGGKTTLLRAVAAKMSAGNSPKRVAVIDTRGELAPPESEKNLCIDMLSGYPRALGIEIATRTMGAELIVCDEIGDPSEAEAIIAAQNSGVPLVASAHADGILPLLRRSGIRRLHDAHVFESYVGIERVFGDFRYEFFSWEMADDILQNSRGNDTAYVGTCLG